MRKTRNLVRLVLCAVATAVLSGCIGIILSDMRRFNRNIHMEYKEFNAFYSGDLENPDTIIIDRADRQKYTPSSGQKQANAEDAKRLQQKLFWGTEYDVQVMTANYDSLYYDEGYFAARKDIKGYTYSLAVGFKTYNVTAHPR
jgi:hypothetical protein